MGFYKKYNGLCELICNRILIDNDLGRGTKYSYLKSRVTISRLNEDKITKSHLLDVYSIFFKAIAILLKIYPDNILFFWDQWGLLNNNRSVNNELLNKGLGHIENGGTLKLEVFKRESSNFVGHSLLIKKTENNKYIFFDPNQGEYRDLPFSVLSTKINEQIKIFNATDIYIAKGTHYLSRLSY